MIWLRRHWRWLLLVFVVLTGAGLYYVLHLLGKQREAAKLQAELIIFKAQIKVTGLKSDQKARQIELIQNREMAQVISKEIVEAKKLAVAAVKQVDGMTDLEISQEFSKLGF